MSNMNLTAGVFLMLLTSAAVWSTSEAGTSSLQKAEAKESGNSESSSCDLCQKKFENLENKLKRLQKKVDNLSWDKMDVEASVERLRHFPGFYQTDTRGSKVYLISSSSDYFSKKNAKRACRQVRGKLVEFDQDGEYEFVRGFVKSYLSETWYVFTGYMREQEGVPGFAHLQSGNPLNVTRFPWGGTNNSSKDCSALYRYTRKGFHLVPAACGTTKGKFACEISVR